MPSLQRPSMLFSLPLDVFLTVPSWQRHCPLNDNGAIMPKDDVIIRNNDVIVENNDVIIAEGTVTSATRDGEEGYEGRPCDAHIPPRLLAASCLMLF